MDFNKLTIKSQEAIAGAQELARRRGNPELAPEHLVLALLDQELPNTLLGATLVMMLHGHQVPALGLAVAFFLAYVGADWRPRRTRPEDRTDA